MNDYYEVTLTIYQWNEKFCLGYMMLYLYGVRAMALAFSQLLSSRHYATGACGVVLSLVALSSGFVVQVMSNQVIDRLMNWLIEQSYCDRYKRWTCGLCSHAGRRRYTGRYMRCRNSSSPTCRPSNATAILWPDRKHPVWSWKYLAASPTVARLWRIGPIATIISILTCQSSWWWLSGPFLSSSNHWHSSFKLPFAKCRDISEQCFDAAPQNSSKYPFETWWRHWSTPVTWHRVLYKLLTVTFYHGNHSVLWSITYKARLNKA